jgi:hypothetical protein
LYKLFKARQDAIHIPLFVFYPHKFCYSFKGVKAALFNGFPGYYRRAVVCRQVIYFAIQFYFGGVDIYFDIAVCILFNGVHHAIVGEQVAVSR